MGSIRNRISALRVKQRNMYEKHGWELPEGGAGHSAKKAKTTPSKRVADGEDVESETPTKKPRASRKKKQSKSASPEKRSAAEDEEEMTDSVKMKEEIDEI